MLAIPTPILLGLFVREVHRRFREGLDDSTGYWLRLGAVTGLVAISLQEIVERCNACGWRGWAVDEGPKVGDREIQMATRVLAPEPPNLTGTVLARKEEVADLDVTKLDCLMPIEDKPDE